MKYEVKYMVVHQGGALVCSEYSFMKQIVCQSLSMYFRLYSIASP